MKTRKQVLKELKLKQNELLYETLKKMQTQNSDNMFINSSNIIELDNSCISSYINNDSNVSSILFDH